MKALREIWTEVKAIVGRGENNNNKKKGGDGGVGAENKCSSKRYERKVDFIVIHRLVPNTKRESEKNRSAQMPRRRENSSVPIVAELNSGREG